MRTRESHSCGEVLGTRLHILIDDLQELREHLLDRERRDFGLEISKDRPLAVCRTPILILLKGYFVGLTLIIQHQVDRINNGLQVTYMR